MNPNFANDLGRTRERIAFRFVLMLGMVSLFGDMTYEGARSISGPYLGLLGASGAVVGITSGLGEFIGYGLRLISGRLSDRTGRYWSFTILGYAINLLAVPALALTGSWQLAAVLLVTERIGKGIRKPAVDSMLSHAASRVGRGWGFGLHEAMDQIGAIAGPLIIAYVLASGGSYSHSFAILLIPAVAALIFLLIGRLQYPNPEELEIKVLNLKTKGLPKTFWLYVIPSCLMAAGYLDFPIIAFHFQKASIASVQWIPILYAIAMGTDAIAALVLGRLFDRIGLWTLVGSTLVSALFAPLALLGNFQFALLGVCLWGIGLGAQESILRAVIAGLVASERRASAYGVFDTIYGVSWFAGSAAMGLLYDVSIRTLIGFSMMMQLAATILYIRLARMGVESRK